MTETGACLIFEKAILCAGGPQGVPVGNRTGDCGGDTDLIG